MDEIKKHLSPVEVLKIALEKEKAAYQMYQDLMRYTKVKMVSNLLEFLSGEEYKHRKMIEAKLEEIQLVDGI